MIRKIAAIVGAVIFLPSLIQIFLYLNYPNDPDYPENFIYIPVIFLVLAITLMFFGLARRDLSLKGASITNIVLIAGLAVLIPLLIIVLIAFSF